jgi:YggT family protein
MGRPWWYNSYWQKGQGPQRRFRLPGRQTLVWVVLIGLSLLLAVSQTGFEVVWLAWFLGFVYYLCRILALAIFVRAILSWFAISRYNLFMVLLDDVTEPLLSPLRQVVPTVGMFDITPLIAIIILYFIPSILIGLISIII